MEKDNKGRMKNNDVKEDSIKLNVPFLGVLKELLETKVECRNQKLKILLQTPNPLLLLPIEEEGTFNNDTNFINQIEKEFIFCLYKSNNNLLVDTPFNKLILFTINVIQLIIQSGTIDKKIFKQILLFILNAIICNSEQEEDNIAFLIKSLKELTSEIKNNTLVSTTYKVRIL